MSEFLEIVNKADAGRVWRVLDEFMDALKEAQPDVYRDLVHDLQKKIGKCVLKCVLTKENAADFNESAAFIRVGVTGFEPTASWSRTKRATNCATPRKEKPQQLGCCGVVGDERIELPRAESESAALPLCESPVGCPGCVPSTFIYYSD